MSCFLTPYSTKVECRDEFPWSLEERGSGGGGDGFGLCLSEATHGFWDRKTAEAEEILGEMGRGKDQTASL